MAASIGEVFALSAPTGRVALARGLAGLAGFAEEGGALRMAADPMWQFRLVAQGAHVHVRRQPRPTLTELAQPANSSPPKGCSPLRNGEEPRPLGKGTGKGPLQPTQPRHPPRSRSNPDPQCTGQDQ